MWSSFFDELEKIATATTSRKDEEAGTKLMRGVVTARPWVGSAAKTALPAATLASLLPIPETHRRKATIIGGVLGGAAGVGDRYVKEWAARHPKSHITKKLQQQAATESIGKTAAMAGDLRRNGIGGVRQPPFPTEDSKQFAEKQLNTSQHTSSFSTHTMPRHLTGTGPSINQTAALPR